MGVVRLRYGKYDCGPWNLVDAMFGEFYAPCTPKNSFVDFDKRVGTF